MKTCLNKSNQAKGTNSLKASSGFHSVKTDPTGPHNDFYFPLHHRIYLCCARCLLASDKVPYASANCFIFLSTSSFLVFWSECYFSASFWNAIFSLSQGDYVSQTKSRAHYIAEGNLEFLTLLPPSSGHLCLPVLFSGGHKIYGLIVCWASSTLLSHIPCPSHHFLQSQITQEQSDSWGTLLQGRYYHWGRQHLQRS